MKSQGLPMSTIVLIVVGLIVLASLAIFLMGGLSRSTESTSGSIDKGKCMQLCVNAKMIGASIYGGGSLPYCVAGCDSVYKCCVGGYYIECDSTTGEPKNTGGECQE